MAIRDNLHSGIKIDGIKSICKPKSSFSNGEIFRSDNDMEAFDSLSIYISNLSSVSWVSLNKNIIIGIVKLKVDNTYLCRLYAFTRSNLVQWKYLCKYEFDDNISDVSITVIKNTISPVFLALMYDKNKSRDAYSCFQLFEITNNQISAGSVYLYANPFHELKMDSCNIHTSSISKIVNMPAKNCAILVCALRSNGGSYYYSGLGADIIKFNGLEIKYDANKYYYTPSYWHRETSSTYAYISYADKADDRTIAVYYEYASYVASLYIDDDGIIRLGGRYQTYGSGSGFSPYCFGKMSTNTFGAILRAYNNTSVYAQCYRVTTSGVTASTATSLSYSGNIDTITYGFSLSGLGAVYLHTYSGSSTNYMYAYLINITSSSDISTMSINRSIITSTINTATNTSVNLAYTPLSGLEVYSNFCRLKYSNGYWQTYRLNNSSASTLVYGGIYTNKDITNSNDIYCDEKTSIKGGYKDSTANLCTYTIPYRMLKKTQSGTIIGISLSNCTSEDSYANVLLFI